MLTRYTKNNKVIIILLILILLIFSRVYNNNPLMILYFKNFFIIYNYFIIQVILNKINYHIDITKIFNLQLIAFPLLILLFFENELLYKE